uniref:ATP synthase F0 subunit 8 n=1 Tax=Herposiphonia versicolor TaxID=2007163 RepID=UPI0022FD7DA6|nr:ATP synthase F0 subunit 8 [Herposiphonia versicolor]WAX04197.1 ATP synthase F0 subunit 8 [Herposiphonia versicolor]
MPQLDFIIVLPQIFWLVLFFISFYFILTYLFLPFFLKTILSRTKFIEFNYITELQLIKEVFEKRQFIIKKLNFSFNKIHSILFLNVLIPKFNFINKPFKDIYLIKNKIFFLAVKKTLYFCNPIILNSFKFYPSFLNKKT